jgi:hypothetical protein
MKLLLVAGFLAQVSAWGYCNDNDLSCANWAKAGYPSIPRTLTGQTNLAKAHSLLTSEFFTVHA